MDQAGEPTGEPTGEPPAAETYLVHLTRGPVRPDGARTSLLPRERRLSAEELRHEHPDVAHALRDGRLSGPMWSDVGTKHEAAFATYGELKAAFPGLAEYIRMNGPEPVDESVPDVRLVVYVTDPDG